MLRSQALWFARPDTLGDPHEGSIPPFDVSGQPPGVAEQMAAFRKAVQRILYVNCWDGGDDESLAMWSLYAGLDSGVAIRSTVGDLIDSIGDLDRTLNVGLVDYITYDLDPGLPDPSDLYSWHFRKRRSYRHEEEIRAIAFRPEDLDLFNNDPYLDATPTGILVPVDLDRLVSAVYVAPTSPKSHEARIREIVAESHAHWQVRRSEIDREPVF